MAIASPVPLDSLVSDDVSALSESGKPTMLVVDDEDGPRQSLDVIFKDEFQLLFAENGVTAIDLAQRHDIDIAVLDIRMAGMTGLEVLERLKFIDPTIEAVMMTAFETNDTLRQALRLQACDYVNKPFDIATIRGAVASAMERRSQSCEFVKYSEEVQQLQSEVEQQKLEGQIVRTRGEIYASILHDINGPLTVISGLLQIINQQIAHPQEITGEDFEQLKDRLKRITRQVTSCIEISRRYLGYLRQGPRESARVWVNQILNDLGELVRVHPCARNHQVFIQPLPQDVLAYINGTDLIQILLNLCLNALQCTPRLHRVTVSGQFLQHPLDLAQFPDGPQNRLINREDFYNSAPLMALAVEDNGPGIPSETLPKIFEAFFSSQNKPHGTGTGLGLSIVQRLVKNARGALHVHSVPNQGSLFTLYIPAASGPLETGAAISI